MVLTRVHFCLLDRSQNNWEGIYISSEAFLFILLNVFFGPTLSYSLLGNQVQFIAHLQ